MYWRKFYLERQRRKKLKVSMIAFPIVYDMPNTNQHLHEEDIRVPVVARKSTYTIYLVKYSYGFY